MSWRGWLPPKDLSLWRSALAGAGLGAGSVAVTSVLGGAIGRDARLVIFLPFVALAAAIGGVAGGVASLAIEVIAAATVQAGSGSGPDLAVFCVASALVIAVIAALGRAIRDLRSREASLASAKAQLQTVAGELAHRNRNSLFVIMSIVSQSAANASSAAEAARTINSRLEALLRAQDLLVQSETGAIGLKALLHKALQPFGLERFEIDASPEVLMATDVGVGLGLLFHELATNAVKHGALSSPAGRVFIEWDMAGEMARLTWREAGGPAVREPARQGFGSRLFQVALVPQGGRVERRFEAGGLVCELRIPAPPNPPRFLSPVSAGSVFVQGGRETVASA